MKATKYRFDITCEILSTDTIPGLLHEICSNLERENLNGSLTKSDGDRVQWHMTSEEVEILAKTIKE